MLLFLFDMDDVLYDYDFGVRVTALSAVTGLPAEEIQQRWWHTGGERAAQAGAYATPEAYLEAFSAALGTSVSAEDWLAAREAAMTPRPDVHEVVRLAATMGQVSLLTNNGAMVSAHLTRLAPELVPLFGEHLFTSSDYGVRKPHPEVFQRAMARYGAAPEDTFFADDLPENIAGAASLGITAHHYREPAALRDAVVSFARSRGVEPAPLPA